MYETALNIGAGPLSLAARASSPKGRAKGVVRNLERSEKGATHLAPPLGELSRRECAVTERANVSAYRAAP